MYVELEDAKSKSLDLKQEKIKSIKLVFSESRKINKLNEKE